MPKEDDGEEKAAEGSHASRLFLGMTTKTLKGQLILFCVVKGFSNSLRVKLESRTRIEGGNGNAESDPPAAEDNDAEPEGEEEEFPTADDAPVADEAAEEAADDPDVD